MYPGRQVAALLLAASLTGCSHAPARPDAAVSAGCPTSLAGAVHLSVSVAAASVPDGIRVPSGSVRLIAGVGRRLLLSVEVDRVPRVRLVENSLEINTFGGTLAGWARVRRPASAEKRESLQASGNYLRLAPFLPGHALQSHTQAIDVLVLPGGESASQLALRPGRMWDKAGNPTPPGALKITLDPIQHMSVLDVVNATATLDLLAQHRSGAHEYWECAIQSDFQLVDHDSVLPGLWLLRHAKRGGGRDELAFYKPTVGTLPLIFLDPATAGGFARWLIQTHATGIAGFVIGWTASDKTTGFQAAPRTGVSDLAVKQLGSD